MEAMTQKKPALFVVGKREKDILEAYKLLIAKGETEASACMIIAYRFYTSADEVLEICTKHQEEEEPQEAVCVSMKDYRHKQITTDFEDLLMLRCYTIDAITKMVALKHEMEEQSVYKIYKQACVRLRKAS
jgi:hypothetical protein